MYTIYIVGNDCNSTRTLVSMLLNVEVIEHPSAEEFLETYDGRAGVLMTGMVTTGMSSLELQKSLRDWDIFIPVVVVAAVAKTHLVVEAIRNGASAVLEKPLDAEQLRLSLTQAMREYQGGYKKYRATQDAQLRLTSLTQVERDVVELLLGGLKNSQIARELDVSIRTVEARRRKIFDKMNAANFTEFLRKVFLFDSGQGRTDLFYSLDSLSARQSISYRKVRCMTP